MEIVLVVVGKCVTYAVCGLSACDRVRTRV